MITITNRFTRSTLTKSCRVSLTLIHVTQNSNSVLWEMTHWTDKVQVQQYRSVVRLLLMLWRGISGVNAVTEYTVGDDYIVMCRPRIPLTDR